MFVTNKTNAIRLHARQVKQTDVSEWWAKRRGKYNLGLVAAGLCAFVLMVLIVMLKTITNNDPGYKGVELTLFTILFQGIGYLIMMGIANLLYNLGAFADRRFNQRNSEVFRIRLFNLGFRCSCSLPFIVPVLVIFA